MQRPQSIDVGEGVGSLPPPPRIDLADTHLNSLSSAGLPAESDGARTSDGAGGSSTPRCSGGRGGGLTPGGLPQHRTFIDAATSPLYSSQHQVLTQATKLVLPPQASVLSSSALARSASSDRADHRNGLTLEQQMQLDSSDGASSEGANSPGKLRLDGADAISSARGDKGPQQEISIVA